MGPMTRTVALIVATDPGAGFATPKYLEPVGGVPLLQRVVDGAGDWPVDEMVVVLGPDAEAIIEGVDFGGATVVIDPEWKEGISASMRVAIDLLLRGPATDRIVVALGDQPGIETATVAALLDRPAAVVVPKYRYRRGWPVVLSSELWDLLLGLEGSADLHDVLETHAGAIDELWLDRLETPRLLDPADFSSR